MPFARIDGLLRFARNDDHDVGLLKQTELLPAALWLHEMIGGQFRAALVQPELLAGDLESATDHPGHRPGAFHARAPLRIVVTAAAHVADQSKDVAIAV